jgi:RNA polymerase sigma-70 factor (ECF subfamily)
MNSLAELLPRLRRFARALTCEAAAGDKLVENAIGHVMSRRNRQPEGVSLDDWLLSVMHKLFIGRLGRERRRTLRRKKKPETQSGAAPVRDTEGDMLGMRDLDLALFRLPGDLRELLLLVTIEELSYEDTAKILGMPTDAVIANLSRARERLRILLDEDNQPAPGTVAALSARAPLAALAVGK